jgi:hypothetical protein
MNVILWIGRIVYSFGQTVLILTSGTYMVEHFPLL